MEHLFLKKVSRDGIFKFYKLLNGRWVKVGLASFKYTMNTHIVVKDSVNNKKGGFVEITYKLRKNAII